MSTQNEITKVKSFTDLLTQSLGELQTIEKDIQKKFVKLDEMIGKHVQKLRTHTSKHDQILIEELEKTGITLTQAEKDGITNNMYSSDELKGKIASAGITIPKKSTPYTLKAMGAILDASGRTLSDKITRKQISGILSKLPSLKTESKLRKELHKKHQTEDIEPLTKGIASLQEKISETKMLSEDDLETIQHMQKRTNNLLQKIAPTIETEASPYTQKDIATFEVEAPRDNVPD